MPGEFLCLVLALGFRVWDFRVWGSGFRVPQFGVLDLGFGWVLMQLRHLNCCRP